MPTLFALIAVVLGMLTQEYPKLAPFRALRFEGEVPHVQVDGEWWILEKLDGIEMAELVSFAREKHGSRWAKRLGEDLVQVLGEYGKKPGETVKLELAAEKGGKKRVIAGAKMTAENRRAVLEANRALESAAAPEPAGASLSRSAALEDARALAEWMERSYSYFRKPAVDAGAARAALERALESASEPIEARAFALLVMRYLAAFGDGHTRPADPPEAFLPPGYLPCLLEDAGGRVVALREDRADFVDSRRPYLVAIDGVPIERWIEAARAITPGGAPHAVRRSALRNLRFLAFARAELGLAPAGEVRLELQGEREDDRSVRALPLAERKPNYGVWPRSESARIGRGKSIGYLRIERMEDDAAFLDAIERALADFETCKGLVIDVRDNGGGSRDVTARLVPRFLPEELSPRVANVAAKRLEPGEDPGSSEGFLADRRLHPRASARFSEPERAAIDATLARFRPEWELPKGEFSAWHFLVLERDAARPLLGKKVVVLMNGGCFSATDIFLGAMKGLPAVTLLGTASGGGSGRAREFELPRSRLRIQASSMASFQADGKLFDGRGIEPDVVVQPKATDFLGRTDAALEAALDFLSD